MLIVKRAEEIRDQLELKWRDDKRHFGFGKLILMFYKTSTTGLI